VTITSTAVVALVVAPPAPLLYSFTLGLVAAVNPCGFPLLPAYLATFAGDRRAGGAVQQTARGLLAGACVSVGFLAVFGVLGALVESGAHLVMGWVPWAMVPLGAAMTVLGVLAALGRQTYLRLPVPRLRRSGRVLGMVAFGVAYAVASLSCALPVFLAGVAGSFTRLGLLAGVGTFVAYALGMALLLMVASLVVAHAGTSLLRRAMPLARILPRLIGVVLALVGAYLVLYWVNDLTAPSSSPAPIRVVEQVQTALSGWLAGSARLAGTVLGAAVVAALVALAIASRRSGGVAGLSRERQETAPAGDAGQGQGTGA
jgi:cytochrome c-type biogenesis protein